MKTFNEKDLITWSNREKAVIGNEYYFGNCLYDIKYRIKEGIYTVLTTIDNNCYNYPFHIERTATIGFALRDAGIANWSWLAQMYA